ncbi:MAG: hypothetical protein ACR2PG_22535 [Hyphomicrobiaceae bacterium]
MSDVGVLPGILTPIDHAVAFSVRLLIQLGGRDPFVEKVPNAHAARRRIPGGALMIMPPQSNSLAKPLKSGLPAPLSLTPPVLYQDLVRENMRRARSQVLADEACHLISTVRCLPKSADEAAGHRARPTAPIVWFYELRPISYRRFPVGFFGLGLLSGVGVGLLLAIAVPRLAMLGQ